MSASALATVETVLRPGSYAALNDSGNGQPAFAPFTVTQSPSPAAPLPAAATQTAVEFRFWGPMVLFNGTVVRAQNLGWLVHMIGLIRAPHESTGYEVMELLRAGKDNEAMQLVGPNPAFVTLLGPASPGAMQQQVLHTVPGYYVEACFMDTLGCREHTQLGIERLVHVTALLTEG